MLECNHFFLLSLFCCVLFLCLLLLMLNAQASFPWWFSVVFFFTLQWTFFSRSSLLSNVTFFPVRTLHNFFRWTKASFIASFTFTFTLLAAWEILVVDYNVAIISARSLHSVCFALFFFSFALSRKPCLSMHRNKWKCFWCGSVLSYIRIALLKQNVCTEQRLFDYKSNNNSNKWTSKKNMKCKRIICLSWKKWKLMGKRKAINRQDLETMNWWALEKGQTENWREKRGRARAREKKRRLMNMD